MEPSAQQTVTQFKLPLLVFGVVEVRRLKRELEALDEFMRQAAIREPGTQPTLPRLSRMCEALASVNNVNLLLSEHLKATQAFLDELEDEAPNIHMSFATDPSSAFTAKLVAWLRANIHPYLLVEVGLQPTLAAGCVARTNNKMFDMSLRNRFTNSEKLLLESFALALTPNPSEVPPVPTDNADGGVTPTPPAATTPTPAPPQATTGSTGFASATGASDASPVERPAEPVVAAGASEVVAVEPAGVPA
ncbi:MAG TPA: hypothetical protein VLH84_01890 [Patescibacteria group bacterium]|nr:hypothetical protein [Patescibacteria group bacterium]